MSHNKVWNKLRADWDEVDEEVEGMVVLDPNQQVLDHEEEEEEFEV